MVDIKIEKFMVHGGFFFAIILGMFGIQYKDWISVLFSWFFFTINVLHCYSMGYIKVERKKK